MSQDHRKPVVRFDGTGPGRATLSNSDHTHTVIDSSAVAEDDVPTIVRDVLLGYLAKLAADATVADLRQLIEAEQVEEALKKDEAATMWGSKTLEVPDMLNAVYVDGVPRVMGADFAFDHATSQIRFLVDVFAGSKVTACFTKRGGVHQVVSELVIGHDAVVAGTGLLVLDVDQYNLTISDSRGLGSTWHVVEL